MVTGLPPDATEWQIRRHFSSRYDLRKRHRFWEFLGCLSTSRPNNTYVDNEDWKPVTNNEHVDEDSGNNLTTSKPAWA